MALKIDFLLRYAAHVLRNTFLNRKNQWSDLTKIDITFDPFDISW